MSASIITASIVLLIVLFIVIPVSLSALAASRSATTKSFPPNAPPMDIENASTSTDQTTIDQATADQATAMTPPRSYKVTRTVRNTSRRGSRNHTLPRQAHAQSTETKYCLICDEEVPAEAFHPGPLSADCNHPPRACTLCSQTWFSTRIGEGEFQLICPDCKTLLSHAEIKQVLPPDAFEAYDNTLLKRHLAMCLDYQWCLNVSCNSGQFHCGDPLFPCEVCGHRACIACGVPWHEGMSCEDLQKSKADTAGEQENRDFLAATTKNCPECNTAITKAAGCDILTCTNCGVSMCWRCGACVFPGAHTTRCLYHRLGGGIEGDAQGLGDDVRPDRPDTPYLREY